MTMSPTLLSTLALLCALFTHNANAGWRHNGCNLLTASMDSLISPGGISSHVHNVIGGSKFSSTYDYNTLRRSSCTTTVIPDDKSNYWAPALYYKNRNNGTLSLVPSDWGIYYFHRGTETKIHQFPPGFRMIAGSSNRNSTSDTPEDMAVRWYCLDTSLPPNPLTPALPKRHCNQAIMQRTLFPSCWNGRDVTSPNFKDHVKYPVGTPEGGTCPTSHPFRLMTLKFDQIFRAADFEYYEGGFILSTGDNVGYSSHADFQNGWDASDNSILQQAIDTCTDPGNHIENCTVLQPLVDYNDNYCTCRPESEIPIQDVGFYDPLKKLPGDNPIWGGNITKVLTGVSDKPRYGSPYSTLPSNWVEYGCVNDDKFRAGVTVDDKWVDTLMYPGRCVDHCNAKGFGLAGLESGQTCYCGNPNGASLDLTHKRECKSVCGGSRYEFCGASDKVNVYKKTGDSASPANGPIDPPAGSNLTGVL